MSYRTILLLVVLLYELVTANMCLGQMTLSAYQDTVWAHCDTIHYGWYSSETPMSNGDFFKIYLGPLGYDFDGEYIEQNMWGTFRGTWTYVIHGLLVRDDHKNCYAHITLNDTIKSRHLLHYDGDEKYPCWWKTMYFFSNCDTSTTHYVEMKDRTGEIIPMFYIKIEDEYHNIIIQHNRHDSSFARCVIPTNARHIRVGGRDPDVAEGFCEYAPDSGDVTFVILPTANDHRLLLHKNRLEYHTLDQWCRPDGLNAIHLLYTGQKEEKDKKDK